MENEVYILGDLHLGCRGDEHIFLEMKKFYEEEFFPEVKKNRPQAIICLGDTLDKRKTIDFSVLSYIQNVFFKFFEDEQIPLYTIIGNHDLYFKNIDDIIGIQLLSINQKYFHVLTECTELNFNEQVFNLVPWICDSNKDKVYSWIDNQDNKKDKIICGHFAIQGFDMGNGILSHEENITEKQLKDYKLILSGHFHYHSEKNNFVYTGTPYQLTWSDAEANNRWYKFNLDTKTLLPVYTKYKLYNALYSIDDFINTDFQDQYIRLYTTLKECKSKQKTIDKRIKELEALNNLVQIKILSDEKKQETDEEDIENINIDINPLNAIKKVIAEDGEIEDKDKDYFLNLAQNIFKKALEAS